ncbi:MFS transporter [Sphingomonas koreensis]|nr:MFS transporter [Sphingomonas koreensis]
MTARRDTEGKILSTCLSAAGLRPSLNADEPEGSGGAVVPLVALLTGVTVLEGLDLTLASLAAPALATEWQLSKSGLTPLLAAALVGMTIGALVGSWVADRIGRRPVIIASVVVFAAGTIACGFAYRPMVFAALRLASGLGFGAATPSIAALMSEWVPRRQLGKALGVMTIGIPVGGSIGALATSWLLPHLGWRFCFVGAGTVCMVFVVLLLRRLPESPVFSTGRMVEKATGHPGIVSGRPEKVGRLGLLFAAGLRRFNVGLYLAVFASALAIYASGGWVTVNLTEMGLPLGLALRASAVTGMAAVVGALGAGWAVARLGSRATMMLAVLLGLAAASMLALAPGRLTRSNLEIVVVVGLALFGLFTGGIQPSIYLVAARAYPAEIRSLGLGASSIMGRAGAVLSTFLGSALLALDGLGGFYTGIAVLVVCTGAGVILIDRHLPGSRRHQAHALDQTSNHIRIRP